MNETIIPCSKIIDYLLLLLLLRCDKNPKSLRNFSEIKMKLFHTVLCTLVVWGKSVSFFVLLTHNNGAHCFQYSNSNFSERAIKNDFLIEI